MDPVKGKNKERCFQEKILFNTNYFFLKLVFFEKKKRKLKIRFLKIFP